MDPFLICLFWMENIMIIHSCSWEWDTLKVRFMKRIEFRDFTSAVSKFSINHLTVCGLALSAELQNGDLWTIIICFCRVFLPIECLYSTPAYRMRLIENVFRLRRAGVSMWNRRLSSVLANDLVLRNWVDERLCICVRYNSVWIWTRMDSHCDVHLRLFLK